VLIAKNRKFLFCGPYSLTFKILLKIIPFFAKKAAQALLFIDGLSAK
jgi:hypothetical protein